MFSPNVDFIRHLFFVLFVNFWLFFLALLHLKHTECIPLCTAVRTEACQISDHKISVFFVWLCESFHQDDLLFCPRSDVAETIEYLKHALLSHFLPELNVYEIYCISDKSKVVLYTAELVLLIIIIITYCPILMFLFRK